MPSRLVKKYQTVLVLATYPFLYFYNMASILGSIFTSGSTVLARRIEFMRDAELSLASLARSFNKSGSNNHHTLDIFDTRIPRSSVPSLKDGKCSLFGSCPNITQEENDGEDEHLIIHGVRVISSDHPKNADEASPYPLVLLHGYANGALYFYRNLFGLCTHHFKKVYALDMLGWGLSSRPPFETHDESIESAESVFVESLEAWRKANDIPKMILGGHSMGGYLSVAYCEKYPEYVDRLILISPVGVPEQDENALSKLKNIPLQYKIMLNLVNSLWTNGITPSSFLRSIPKSRGRKLVGSYIDKRIPAITSVEEKSTLADYLYINAILPGSGEYCLNRLLKPLAYARKPLVHRIPELQISKITFLYGAQDWMDPNGALDVQSRCKEMADSNYIRHNDEGKNEKTIVPSVEVYGVKNAGHLLMLENWEEFNSAVVIAGGGEHTLPSDAPKPYIIDKKK